LRSREIVNLDTYLPANSLSRMVQLQVLILDHNKLTTLSGAGSLLLLQELSVSHNQLASGLFSSCSNLKHLKKLFASHNRVKDVSGLSGCTFQLETLLLDHNSIEDFPKCQEVLKSQL